MMTTKLKICGITRLEDARYCAAAGADYLGFIQYEKSPRYIEPERARQIVEWVYGPVPVGVFVDAPADVVNRTASKAGFQAVQLHGNEPVFEVARVELPVIKALHVAPDTSADDLRRLFRDYEDVVDYFLLDTYSADLHGGTGRTFDWDTARSAISEHRTFLAGGVGASNVATAVAELRPYAVDVSSSVESAPGIKDFEKLDAFFQAFDGLRAQHEA